MKHGWYSETQAKIFGTSIWSGPNGEEVEITEVKVSDEPSLFGDAEYKGLVKECVRVGTRRRNPFYPSFGYPDIEEE